MERSVWADERLDELAHAVREGFARVDCDMAEMRTEIRDLRTLTFRLWGTNMLMLLVTLVAVIVTRS